MLWVVAYAIDELIRLEFTSANIVDCSEKGESTDEKRKHFEYSVAVHMEIPHLPLFHFLILQHEVDFFSGDWSLQFLAIQHFGFKLIDRFSASYERCGYFTIAAT